MGAGCGRPAGDEANPVCVPRPAGAAADDDNPVCEYRGQGRANPARGFSRQGSRRRSAVTGEAGFKLQRKLTLKFRNAASLESAYDVSSESIGEGAFGAVRLGKHRATGTVRAIKSVPKGGVLRQQASKKEIATMAALSHPCIVALFETFADRAAIHIVMEHCAGGDLFERLTTAGRFPEREAAGLMRDTLSAAQYLHGKRIAHRDMKPENFLFAAEGPVLGNGLRLIDFGAACPCRPGAALKSRAGTPLYMAPQVLAHRYDLQCDVWSLGVVLYVLLSGQPPFRGSCEKEVLANVRQGRWSFYGDAWQGVGEEAKQLVRELLRFNPHLRPTAERALRHAWVQRGAPAALDPSRNLPVFGRLCSFEVQNNLERAALAIIAGHLKQDGRSQAAEAFAALDTNGDGEVSIDELAKGLEKAGIFCDSQEVEDLMDRLDSDGSGTMDFSEFLAATLDRKTQLTDDVVSIAFSAFDRDGDGKLSPHEVRSLLATSKIEGGPCARVAQRLVRDADGDGDGAIDFQDFAAFLRKEVASN